MSLHPLCVLALGINRVSAAKHTKASYLYTIGVLKRVGCCFVRFSRFGVCWRVSERFSANIAIAKMQDPHMEYQQGCNTFVGQHVR